MVSQPLHVFPTWADTRLTVQSLAACVHYSRLFPDLEQQMKALLEPGIRSQREKENALLRLQQWAPRVEQLLAQLHSWRGGITLAVVGGVEKALRTRRVLELMARAIRLASAVTSPTEPPVTDPEAIVDFNQPDCSSRFELLTALRRSISGFREMKHFGRAWEEQPIDPRRPIEEEPVEPTIIWARTKASVAADSSSPLQWIPCGSEGEELRVSQLGNELHNKPA